jgi:hypothetical protein
MVTTLMFEALEERLKEILSTIDGEVKKEALAEVQKLKNDEVAIAAKVAAFKKTVEAAVAAAAPEVQTAVMSALNTLIADLVKLLSSVAVKELGPDAQPAKGKK